MITAEYFGIFIIWLGATMYLMDWTSDNMPMPPYMMVMCGWTLGSILLIMKAFGGSLE